MTCELGKSSALRLSRRDFVFGGLVLPFARLPELEPQEFALSPLKRLLSGTKLTESKIGLVNGHFWNEDEEREIGHFSYPVKIDFTLRALQARGHALAANSEGARGLKLHSHKREAHKRLAARAQQAVKNGSQATAIIELERTLNNGRLRETVRALSQAGVSTFVVGNEPNDPQAAWRDNFERIFKACKTTRETLDALGLKEARVSLPGLAYFGNGDYLRRMLRYFKEQEDPIRSVQCFADHNYGSVFDFLTRVKLMKNIAKEEKAGHLEYWLTEFGNPSVEVFGDQVTDRQLAEEYIPQIPSLAAGSKLIDRVFCYSLFDGGSPAHSLARLSGHSLHPKETYKAYYLITKLLSRLVEVNIVQEEDRTLVSGSRWDGINFKIAWANSNQPAEITLPDGARAFNALGEELIGKRFVLKKAAKPYLGGPALIMVEQSSKSLIT